MDNSLRNSSKKHLNKTVEIWFNSAKLMSRERAQTFICLCFQAKGFAQTDAGAFISNSGGHRLYFPLWLKSSFRVKADVADVVACVTFSSGWTSTRTNQTAVCQPFHSTGLVLSPTNSGYSQICPCSRSSTFFIPTESKTQNAKKQLTIWSTSSWALCLLDTFITDALTVVKK